MVIPPLFSIWNLAGESLGFALVGGRWFSQNHSPMDPLRPLSEKWPQAFEKWCNKQKAKHLMQRTSPRPSVRFAGNIHFTHNLNEGLLPVDNT